MEVVNQQIEQVKAGANAQATAAVNAAKTQASQVVSGLTSKLRSAALTGSDILGASPNIGQYIFGSVGSLFEEVNSKVNTTLGNFTQETKNILQKNFSEIPKTLGVFGSGNLSSKGLGFIASTTSKAIEGVDLPGAEAINNFGSMGVGQLARLSAMGSEVLNSGSNAFEAITDGLKSAWEAGSNIVNNVTSGISSSVDTVLKPITEAAKPVSTLLNKYSTANIIYNNLDFLPTSIRSYISDAGGSFVGNATANALNSLGSIAGINNLAGATKIASSILNDYGNKYYNQASSNGEYVNGFSSYEGDGSSFTSLVNLASKLCSSLDGNIPTVEFGTNKNIYDMLIQLACQMGLGGIADMLLNCLDTGELFDSRTKQILGDLAKNSASRGDTFSFGLSMKYANGYVGNQQNLLTSLISNSTYSTTNRSNIDESLMYSNLTLRGLATNSTFYSSRTRSVEPVVYDAEIVTVMQATCTDYVDEAITKKDRNLVNGVYNLWHKETHA